MQRLIDFIDALLTIVFWPITKLFGIKKCSKCTIRVRWYQFLLLITYPISLLGLMLNKRAEWDLKANLAASWTEQTTNLNLRYKAHRGS